MIPNHNQQYLIEVVNKSILILIPKRRQLFRGRELVATHLDRQLEAIACKIVEILHTYSNKL